MNAEAVVAVVAVVASAVVAVYASRSQREVAREDRLHQRLLAAEERTQQGRREAYLEILIALHRLMDVVNRTRPVLGPSPDPPPPIADEDIWRLEALTAAYASPRVKGLVDAHARSRREFQSAVGLLDDMQADGGSPAELKDSYGLTKHQQWMNVEQIRRRLNQGLRDLREVVYAELNPENSPGIPHPDAGDVLRRAAAVILGCLALLGIAYLSDHWT